MLWRQWQPAFTHTCFISSRLPPIQLDQAPSTTHQTYVFADLHGAYRSHLWQWRHPECMTRCNASPCGKCYDSAFTREGHGDKTGAGGQGDNSYLQSVKAGQRWLSSVLSCVIHLDELRNVTSDWATRRPTSHRRWEVLVSPDKPACLWPDPLSFLSRFKPVN